MAVGLILMVPLHWLRLHLKEAMLQNTLSLLIPFVAYAAAEQVGASGVLAVVVVALYLGHRAWQVDFETRLQEAAVWRMVSFILESTVFALIGLQLPLVLEGLGPVGYAQALWYAFALFVVVVAVRFVWSYPATYLPIWLSPRIKAREADTDWRRPLVVSWAGMRGVVSLAIAFSIPLTTHDGDAFTARNLVLFLTFTTVIGTLVVQGLTLPGLIRLLKLPGRDARSRTLAEAQAQNAASRAADERLDELLQDRRNDLPGPLVDRLRLTLERRRNAVWERLGQPNPETGESVDDTYRRLHPRDDRRRAGRLRPAAGRAGHRRRADADAAAQARPGGGRGLPRGGGLTSPARSVPRRSVDSPRAARSPATARFPSRRGRVRPSGCGQYGSGAPVTTAVSRVPAGNAPSSASTVSAHSVLAT